MLTLWQRYTRAQRDDYDAWKTPGWTTDELYPFLKKVLKGLVSIILAHDQ